ncbi:MFS transporter [Ornithinimicrobium humiphilum]|uniref:MFS transporter n=1 Tax=Ornithinimicrobium humiphilum TaxID=125288 RepID=A0A543KKT1_9MICO|nr:MFS transporter [Ornithinimicrobium humiphilum]TQM95686.1 MFS transporter [Ornithinimicrobium humiphilum]
MLVPSVLVGIAGGATVPVSVLAALELGASPALASLVIALVGLATLATTVLAGRFIDRLGDRRAMLVATAAAAGCTALSVGALAWGGSGALALFVVSLVLRAPVMNVWNLSRQALVAEHVPVERRGRAMTALGGTMRAGTLLGPLLGAALLLQLPLWSVYVLSVGCALLALGVLYTPAGSTLDTAARAARSDGHGSGATADGSQGTRSRTPAPGPTTVRWRAVLLAGVAVGTLALARVAQPVVLQLWGVSLGFSESTISLLVALGAAVELVLMFPGGRLKDTLGRSPVLVLCLAVYGAGFVLLAGLPSLVGAVVAVLVMAVGNGLGAGINMTIGADLSPAVDRARFLGTWALFSAAGSLAGPATVSALVAVGSARLALLGIAAVALAGSAWMAGWARVAALPGGVGRGR